MQVFWPEKSYTLSAMALDDRRLNKQIIELGQILSTAIWIEDCGEAEMLYAKKEIYLPAYENHPVVRNCKNYFHARVDYLSALLSEYGVRFKKHHSLFLNHGVYWNACRLFKKYPQFSFQNYTTYHKHIQNTNLAYQQCLIEKWKTGSSKWTNRNRPLWAN